MTIFQSHTLIFNWKLTNISNAKTKKCYAHIEFDASNGVVIRDERASKL